ncbi:hypothetical protein V8C86DRAFT_3022151 [Haematococcus lacustris]
MDSHRVVPRYRAGLAMELNQFWYLLRKAMLQKRRGWTTTLIEVLSPVVIMLGLVYAFHVTKIDHYSEHNYAGDLATLTERASNILVTALESSRSPQCVAGAMAAVVDQLPPLQLDPVTAAQLAAYQDASRDFSAQQLIQAGYPGFSGAGAEGEEQPPPVPPRVASAARQAAHVLVDAMAKVVADPSMQANLQLCMQNVSRVLARSVMDLYMTFINVKAVCSTLGGWGGGPQPVFTLDEYLLVSKALKAAIALQPEVDQVLMSFKRDFGWNWLGNLVRTGALAFTPDTPQVRQLAASLAERHVYFKDVFLGVLPREQLKAMAADGYNFWAVVDFASGPEPGGSADYSIRMALLETPETYIPINKFSHGTSRRYKMYFVSGFFSIESAINNYILGHEPSMEGSLVVPQLLRWNLTHNTPPVLMPDMESQPYSIWSCAFPKAQYDFNAFYAAAGPMLGLLMCLSLVFPLAMLIRGMVEEKESKLREVLSIMGLRPHVLQASWVATYFVVFVVISLLMVLVTGTTFLSTTSWSLLAAYFLVFSLSELAFGVMVSSFFSRAKVSAIVGPLAHFAFMMPRYTFYKTAPSQAIGGKLAVSLLAPSAFTFGMDTIAAYEGAGAGLQWSGVWSDPLPVAACMLMMMLDTLLYFLLAAYFDKVIPNEYGATLPWWFPLDPRPWARAWRRLRQHARHPHLRLAGRGPGEHAPLLAPAALPPSPPTPSLHAPRSSSSPRGGGGQLGQLQALHGVGAEGQEGQEGEEEAGGVAVDLKDLHMRYPNGVVAVHKLSLQMRSGQITALLGHNGAGKSTTVAMMTGLVMPTSGDAFIGGASIVEDTRNARQSLGICPQQNVLIGHLSVQEHLVLLAAIKGIKGHAQCLAAAEEMRAMVGLSPADAPAMATTLSGGMKRKLQMGMALIGGSKVVLADEPTSGWVILVTPVTLTQVTHRSLNSLLPLLHLCEEDEADLLSDNIAIMSGGRLCALGPPLALKEQHGHGYTLAVTLTPGSSAAADPTAATDLCMGLKHGDGVTGVGKAGAGGQGGLLGLQQAVQRLESVVVVLVPGAHRARQAATEVTFCLPFAASGLFPRLFQHLEAHQQALGIAHYGVSMPTLEEVFLNVTAAAATPTPRPAPLPLALDTAVKAGGAAGAIGGLLTAPAAPPQLELLEVVHPGAADGAALPLGGRERPGRPGAAGRASVRPDPDPSGATEKLPSSSTSTSTPSSSSSSSVAGMLAGSGGSSRSIQGAASFEDVSTLVAAREAEAGDMGGQGLGMKHAGGVGRGEAGQQWVMQEAGSWAHAWRAFKAMVHKRARIAARDWKGLLYLFLLPIAAVALTLVILLVNIDPTGPQLQLSLHSVEQFTPVPMVHNPAPGVLAGCVVPATAPATQGGGRRSHPIFEGWTPKSTFSGADTCPNGLAMQDVNATDSYTLSEWLLQQIRSPAPPQYAALMWADPIVLRGAVNVQQSLNSAGNQLAADMAALQGQLMRVVVLVVMLGLTLARAQGVVSNLLARMRQPPVTLLFNASSYHAFMAAYTDIHQALANLDLQAMGAGWSGAVQADWPLLTSHGSQGLLQLSSAALTGGNKYSKASRYLRVANHPLPLTHKEHLAIDTFLSILAAIFCMIPFCYLAGAYCVSPVTEGRNGARALQVGAGCPRYCYWAGSLVWDLAMHGAVSIVSLATFAAFGDASTTGSGQQALATLLLLFGFGCGCVPLTYCMSLGFDSPSAAQVSVSAINFVLGFIFVVGSQTMQGIPECQAFQRVAVHFCRLLPPFNLGEGLINLSTYNLLSMLTKDLTPQDSGQRGSLDSIIPDDAIPTASEGQRVVSGVRSQAEAGAGCREQEVVSGATRTCTRTRTRTRTCTRTRTWSKGSCRPSAATGSIPSSGPTVPCNLPTASAATGIQTASGLLATSQIPHSPFQWDMVGRNLAALYGSSLAFFLLLLLLDAVRTSPAARSKAALAAWALIVPLPYALWLCCALPLRALLRALPRHRRPRAVSSWPLSFKDDLATHLQLSHIWGVTWLRSHGALLGGQKSDLADPSHLGQAGGEGVGYREGGEEERESDTQALLPPLSSRTRLQRNSLSRPLSRQEGEEGTSSHTVHITASGGVGGGAAGRGSSWGKQGGQAQQPGKSGVQGEGEEEEDVDVREERRRVEDRLAVEQDALCIRHLSKVGPPSGWQGRGVLYWVLGWVLCCAVLVLLVYPTRPPKHAVKDLCLGVRRGERFGFLGANGAGKTTTLSILSGQAFPSAGQVLVGGCSLGHAGGEAAVQRLVGYCPQSHWILLVTPRLRSPTPTTVYAAASMASLLRALGAAVAAQHQQRVDPLLELLSAREQVRLYASLKGVPHHRLDIEAQMLLERVGLPAAMSCRASGTLSGGSKRKAALAIALVGSPAAVLLDEPSSGMDPGARRMMWDAVIRATAPSPVGKELLPPAAGPGPGPAALVLTTHYLEEAEALCERVGIMNKGRLACLGTPQHLKARFGACHDIEVHCSSSLVPAPPAHPSPAPDPSLLPQGGHALPAQQQLLLLQLAMLLPGLQLREAAWGRLRLALPLGPGSPPLSRVFQVLESCKTQPGMGLTAYSVGQPSLETVFLAVCGTGITAEGDYASPGQAGGDEAGMAGSVATGSTPAPWQDMARHPGMSAVHRSGCQKFTDLGYMPLQDRQHQAWLPVAQQWVLDAAPADINACWSYGALMRLPARAGLQGNGRVANRPANYMAMLEPQAGASGWSLRLEPEAGASPRHLLTAIRREAMRPRAVNEAAPSQDQPAVGAPVDTVDAAAAPGGIDAADISAVGAAATGREASLAEAEEGVAAAPPMSKSKMKKLAKFEQRKERKEQRRASEKAAKQASKAVKRQEVKAARQTMTEEERKAAAEKAQVASLQRKKEHEERQAKLRQALEPGNQRLAIDLDFAALMSEGDQRHLVQQLSYSYSANGSVAKPCHMHLLWGPGPLRPLAFKMLPGLVNWRVTSAEQTWQQYFKDKLDEVVYLTADSPNELTALDPSKVYVIGGLIDRNRHKGLCFNRAQDAGVATARLPIQKHVQLDSSAVLAVNHVVQVRSGRHTSTPGQHPEHMVHLDTQAHQQPVGAIVHSTSAGPGARQLPDVGLTYCYLGAADYRGVCEQRRLGERALQCTP